MKSIKRNFDKIVTNNPGWSTYTCFAMAIVGKDFRNETIRRWFNKLVNKEDYSSRDKKEVLGFLYHTSHFSKVLVYDLSRGPSKVAEDAQK